jgi:ClpP class serine protease
MARRSVPILSGALRRSPQAGYNLLTSTCKYGGYKTPQHAVQAKLLDGARYDDEVKDELKKRLELGKYDKLHFVSINDYEDAVDYAASGTDRIAVIYAQGDIVDGQGTADNIGGETFQKLIRKGAARQVHQSRGVAR